MSKFVSLSLAAFLLVLPPRIGTLCAGPEKKEPEPKLLEPTAEQLAAAKEAYAKHGAKYFADHDPAIKRVFLTNHVFAMNDATDADLKGGCPICHSILP